MKKWFLPIISGIFLLLGYPPFNLIVLPFLSFLPLFFFLNFKNVSLKKSFLAGFITGLVFFGGIMSWFFNLLPLDWMGVENVFLGLSLVFFFWFLSIFILSIFFGLFSLSCYFLTKRNFWDILLIPSFWVISEYLRVWAFGLLWWGKEVLLGPHLTLGNLAYTLAQNPGFKFLSSFGGIYFLSFLIVFINILIFLLIKNSIETKLFTKKLLFSSIILMVLGLISFSYFFTFPKNQVEENKNLKIAIIQTKFPSFFRLTKDMAEERFQTQTRLLNQALQLSPNLDILVFPEDSRFLAQKPTEGILNGGLSNKEVLIIDSARTETSQGIKSIGTFYNSKKGVLFQYEKLLLSPGGEYLPDIVKLPAQVVNKKWVDNFEKSRGYKKGKEIVIFSNTWQGGMFFCSEVFSPDLHRQMIKKDAQILFNLGSLAFSHGSKILDSQTQAVLQVRAAENGRYLVRATNYGSSYIINVQGEVIKKSPNFENQVLFGEIIPTSKKTFYTKYGDWILIFALGIISFSIVKKRLIQK